MPCCYLAAGAAGSFRSTQQRHLSREVSKGVSAGKQPFFLSHFFFLFSEGRFLLLYFSVQLWIIPRYRYIQTAEDSISAKTKRERRDPTTVDLRRCSRNRSRQDTAAANTHTQTHRAAARERCEQHKHMISQPAPPVADGGLFHTSPLFVWSEIFPRQTTKFLPYGIGIACSCCAQHCTQESGPPAGNICPCCVIPPLPAVHCCCCCCSGSLPPRGAGSHSIPDRTFVCVSSDKLESSYIRSYIYYVPGDSCLRSLEGKGGLKKCQVLRVSKYAAGEYRTRIIVRTTLYRHEVASV